MTREQEKNIKLYEVGYLLSPEIPEADLAVQVNEIKSLIETKGGEVKASDIKKRRLAYPVKKFGQGYFGFIQFTAEPNELEKLKGELKLNSRVLRFLIISQKQDQAEQKTILSGFTPPLRAALPAPPFYKKPAAPEPKKMEPSVPEKEDTKESLEELDKTLKKILGSDAPQK